MTRFTLSLSVGLLAPLLLSGCTREEAPQEDRAMQILRAEADRVAKGGHQKTAPTEPAAQAKEQAHEAQMAELVASEKERDLQMKAHRLPSDNATAHAGNVAVKVTSFSSGHSAKGARAAVTTDRVFLRVELAAQNVGKDPAQVDFAFTQVRLGNDAPFALARDAQVTAGTRNLAQSLAPDARVALTLFFEADPSALGKGLALVIPPEVANAKEVRIPLE
jgi:hypothetical protein